MTDYYMRLEIEMARKKIMQNKNYNKEEDEV